MKGCYPSQKLLDAEQGMQMGQQIRIMAEKDFVEFLAQTFRFLSEGL